MSKQLEIEVETTSHSDAMNKANKRIYDILKIIMPHRLMMEDSPYGENDISSLVHEDDIVSNWPPATICMMNSESAITQTINHYKSLFERQMRNYVTHAISVGDILSFDYISNVENIIDISREYKDSESASKVSDADVWFYEDEVDNMRSYGWKIFIPCFDQLVIKENKKRYFYINTVKRDIKNKTLTLEIHDYMGDKYDWSCSGCVTLKLSFDVENSEGLPCNWELIKATSYEEFLVKYIPDMNWSKEQIQFWYDVLGINAIDEQLLVTIELDDELNLPEKLILRQESDIKRLRKLSTGGIKVSIIAKGKDVLPHQSQAVSERFLLKYCRLITLMNLSLLTANDEINKSDITESTDKNRTILTVEDGDIIRQELRKIKIQSLEDARQRIKEIIQC